MRDALESDCVGEPADDGQGEVLRYRKGEPEAGRAAEAAKSTAFCRRAGLAQPRCATGNARSAHYYPVER